MPPPGPSLPSSHFAPHGDEGGPLYRVAGKEVGAPALLPPEALEVIQVVDTVGQRCLAPVHIKLLGENEACWPSPGLPHPALPLHPGLAAAPPAHVWGGTRSPLTTRTSYLVEAAGGRGAIPLMLRPHVRRRQAQALAIHFLPEAQQAHLPAGPVTPRHGHGVPPAPAAPLAPAPAPTLLAPQLPQAAQPWLGCDSPLPARARGCR